MTQTEIQTLTGFKQKDISKYESGKTKFIPEDYILFWNKKGYNINWIYTGKMPKKEGEQPRTVKDMFDIYEKFERSQVDLVTDFKNTVLELFDLILDPIYDDLENQGVLEKKSLLSQHFKEHRLIKKMDFDNEFVESTVDNFLKRKSGL